jgi:hypothetical protein
VARTDDQGIVASGALVYANAACLPGERATGGGGTFFAGNSHDNHLVSSFPIHVLRDAFGNLVGEASLFSGETADGWEAEAYNAGSPADFVAYVICVSP